MADVVVAVDAIETSGVIPRITVLGKKNLEWRTFLRSYVFKNQLNSFFITFI